LAFGWYVRALIGAGGGLLFIVGRAVYRSAYRKDPINQVARFGIGILASAIPRLGGLTGAIMSWR
jgi:hypothetical protein